MICIMSAIVKTLCIKHLVDALDTLGDFGSLRGSKCISVGPRFDGFSEALRYLDTRREERVDHFFGTPIRVDETLENDVVLVTDDTAGNFVAINILSKNKEERLQKELRELPELEYKDV